MCKTSSEVCGIELACVKLACIMTNPSDSTSAPRGDLATALTHAFALLKKSPDAAEQQAREILKIVPGEKSARLLLAMTERRNGRTKAAVEALTSITGDHPDFAPAHEELGFALISEGPVVRGRECA